MQRSIALSACAALLLLAALGVAARAGTVDSSLVTACAEAKGDASIAACTSEIAIKDIPASELSLAYYNRGAAYVNKDVVTKADGRKAIADFTAAIKVQPDLGAAYYGRAKTYAFLGNKKRAAADFATAEKLNQ